jgi:transcriptional regulator with XRE-family HTH domain
VGIRHTRQDFRDDLRPVLELLRATRKNRGITQRALGDQLGIHQSMVSDLETGRRTPNVSFLAAWARELDMDMNMNFTGSRLHVTVTKLGHLDHDQD